MILSPGNKSHTTGKEKVGYNLTVARSQLIVTIQRIFEELRFNNFRKFLTFKDALGAFEMFFGLFPL